MFGAATGNPIAAASGTALAFVGVATMQDGMSGMLTAHDGKERTSAFERWGGYFLGADGASIGRFASNVLTFSGALRGVRNMAARSASDTDVMDVMKGMNEASGNPCECP